ncbi:MAG: hypothetical protein DWI21_08315 [Planctomycetota bacterium]|nr:MAG: hypothetical protein DWI21_08315 [Planctomycetota bacterium]GDY10864.1 hypothetical protein LBMAG52_43520 [Planctomycetia bacterium]
MSYPLEADSDLDDDAGLHGDGFLVGESGDCSDEYEDVDFEAMGVEPSEPTKAKPGSEEKVLMLAARYAAGMPLWHNDDCTDHGPARDRHADA